MECGAEDACDGKSQDWKATPIPGKAETYMFASAASSAFCMNAVSDPSGKGARHHWRDVSGSRRLAGVEHRRLSLAVCSA